jgi:hypothetical protein
VSEELTKSQIEEIKEAFANDARISYIARDLKIDARDVREALADPAVAGEALLRKQQLYAVELVGLAFDRLADLIRDGEPQHMLQATRLLHQLTSTDWLPQQRGKQVEEEDDVIEIAGLLKELDDVEPEI